MLGFQLPGLLTVGVSSVGGSILNEPRPPTGKDTPVNSMPWKVKPNSRPRANACWESRKENLYLMFVPSRLNPF